MVEEQQEQKSEQKEKFTFLYMKQVPSDTAKQFIELANEEFSGHFGFCLKALLDQLILQQNALSELRMEELEKRVDYLEQSLRNALVENKQEDKPKRKRVGGEVD